MISSPHAGWITFQLEGTKPYDLSYVTDIPMAWLNAAIAGLEQMEPFCVTGFLEPMRMVCVVSYRNCHVFVEGDHEYPIKPRYEKLEHSHTSMLGFCRMLHEDLSSDIDGYATFAYWATDDARKEAEELCVKLDELKGLIEERAGEFEQDRWFC